MRASSLAAVVVLGACAFGGSACAPCADQVGALCLVAGTGVSGFNGDGMDATETDFYQVSSARMAPEGLLHVMDFNNHRLRRIRADGRVETVVGDGHHDFAIEGALATQTPLENPVELAFDATGTLHLIMLHDPRVLRVVLDRIEVVAGKGSLGDSGDGGPARLAQFTQLTGLAFGADGAIYVADELSNRVRKIRPDGVILPFAGTGVAGFSGDGGPAIEAMLAEPRGLVVASDGSVLIADSGNHVIRRVRADGNIETLVGVGGVEGQDDGLLSRPRGVTLMADQTLFVADTGNDRVLRAGTDSTLTVFAGTGVGGAAGLGGDAVKAQLSAPASVSLSREEDRLFISELANSRVTEVRLRAPD